MDDTESTSALRELAYFLTTGIVVSAYGLPVVLARNSVVSIVNTPSKVTSRPDVSLSFHYFVLTDKKRGGDVL